MRSHIRDKWIGCLVHKTRPKNIKNGKCFGSNVTIRLSPIENEKSWGDIRDKMKSFTALLNRIFDVHTFLF